MFTLRNPHSVLAALERRPHDVVEVQLVGGKPRPAWARVAQEAARHGIPVHEVGGGGGPAGGGGGGRAGRGGDRGDRGDRGKKRRGRGDDTGGRGGHSVARVQPGPETPLEELFVTTPGDGRAEAGDHGLWLAVDQVQDPHNLGAVFRSAAFFGVRGLLLTRDRSAPLGEVAYDVASGGVEMVPWAAPPNLDRALKQAREAGLWILGAAGEAERDVREVPRDRPWLLVLGNEETGLRRLTREACDDLCKLTPRGGLDALNVSAAGAVLMSHLTTPVSAPAPPPESP